jgi:inner membrane protein involved in colicin E2 resistance
MLVATAMVVGLTTIAAKVGPRWTGLLSPFPVFALVLGTFTHRSQGAGAVAHLLRGVVLGSLAQATMFVVVASLLIPFGLVWTYCLASLSAVAVNGLALSAVKRTGRRRGP